MNSDDDKFFWRLNLPAISKWLPSLRGFNATNSFNGKTLFLAGDRSNYVKDSDLETIQKYFPNSSLIRVPNSGHWVHSEHPQIVIDAIVKLLKEP